MYEKRILSTLLTLCMVLTLFPVSALATDNIEMQSCTCEVACAAEAMNADCPVCGAEGATIENCGKYEAPVEETEPEQTAIEKVQALINALPDADTITEENRADVEAQLTAIDEAKLPLGDELDALDFSKYNDAIVALNELDGMGGAEVPEMLEDTLQGNGTEADPWILTKEILDSKFSYSSLGKTSYNLNSGMYRLGEDITVTGAIQIGDATVTLDLNGYKLLFTDYTHMFYVTQNTVGVTSRLTLVDGSSGKTSEVRSNTGNVVYTVKNTEFDGNSVPIYGRVSNFGTLSGGVFYGDVGGEASNATITGGTFHGAVSFIGTITGGIFYGAVDADTRINDSAKVTVSFSSDGWTGTQKVLRGQKTSEPTRDGCTCTGCYTDSTYTTAFDFDTAITTDTTLYAKWYCIGTHVDENPKDHKCDLCKATISNHDFGEDGKCECGAVQYTITFDPNGGTVEPTSANTDDEGKLTELPIPTRSGSYRFDGWFTEKNGGTAVTVDTVYEAHTTVYAHWTYTGSTTPDYYVIKATAGEGGSITPSGRAAVLYGASKTFTITPNDGYAIADVKVDGKSVGAVKTYTFERVRGDHTIEAVFMKATGNPQTGVDVPFTDVSENDWFYEDVAYVYANDLMKGTGESTFSPDVTTTRGMIVTILYRLEGEPTVSDNCPFEDVKSGSYYEKAITWAAANEIVGGYGNGKFGPDDPITREQMATILYRYTQYKGMDVSVGEDTNILSYNDAQEISEYAFSAMQWICGESILNGSDGNLMPQGNATRAQVAAILHRFCENILK